MYGVFDKIIQEICFQFEMKNNNSEIFLLLPENKMCFLSIIIWAAVKGNV